MCWRIIRPTRSENEVIPLSKAIDRPKFSCALGGAIATLNAIHRAVPILHAAPGCGLNLSSALNGGSGYAGSGYVGGTALPSSNVCEKEIVFGGEERLTEQIEKTIELIDGDLYFVLSACMVEMIGDDVRGVARGFDTPSRRVLAADTGGFRGNAYRGYEIVLETLFREFVEPVSEKKPHVVNLWGVVPAHDVFWKGNLAHLRALLGKLGLTVNTFFGEGETVESIRRCGDAAFNLVVSDTFGLEPARVFEEVHGTPFLSTAFPIGAAATDAFLREVTLALGLPPADTETLIEAENARYFGFLARLSDVYNDYDLQRYAVIAADANYTPALTRFLAEDIGWIPRVAVVTHPLRDDEQVRILKRFNALNPTLRPNVVFEPNAAALQSIIRRQWPADRGQRHQDLYGSAVLLGSSFELDLAQDLKTPALCVSYPVTSRVVLNRGYAGYEGGLSLAEDLFSLLVSAR